MALNFNVSTKNRLNFDVDKVQAKPGESNPIFKFLDRVISPEVQKRFLDVEERLRPTFKDIKNTVSFLFKNLTGGTLRQTQAALEEREDVPPEKRKAAITPSEVESTIKTGIFPLRQISRPIASIQAVGGALIEGKPAPEVGREALRGFLLPEEVVPIVRKAVPLTKFEIEGPTAALLPRALIEATEEVILFSMTWGGGLSRIRQGIKASQTREALSKAENFIPFLEKAGVKFPPGVTLRDKAVLFAQAAKDPRVGDIFARVILTPNKFYAGLPVPTFKIGDTAKLAGQIGKIISIDGPKAILNVAGKAVVTNLAELAPIKPTAKPRTISGLVKTRGGINPEKLAGLTKENFKETGLGGLLKKDGADLDVIAANLVEEGELLISEGENPSDALVEALQNKSERLFVLEEKGFREAEKALRLEERESKRLLKEVQRLGEGLEKPLAIGKVKPLIQRITGVTTVGDVVELEEGKLLRLKLRAEVRGAGFGLRAGKAIGKEKLQELRGKIELKDRIQKALKTIHKDPKHPETSIDFAAMQELGALREATGVSKKSPLSNMTIDELEGIATQAKVIKVRGREIFKRKAKIRKLKFENDRKQLINNLGPPTPILPKIISTTKEPISKKILGIQLRALRPARMFDLLDGIKDFKGEHSQFFLQRGDTAFTNSLQGETSRKEAYQQLRQRFKIPVNWESKGKIINDLSITNQEIMTMQYALRNPEQLAALKFGNRLSEDTIIQAVNSFTDNERQFAEEFRKLVASRFSAVRKATIENLNKDLGKIEKYFPLYRQKELGSPIDELDEEALLRIAYGRKGVEKGFLISRKDIPAQFQTPMNMNAIEVGLRAIESQERLINYLPLQRDWLRMINDKDYQTALIKRVGNQGAQVVKRWVEASLNPRSVYNSIEPLVTMLRRNSSVVFLGFNVLTMAKQFPSIAFALQEATPADIANSLRQVTLNYETTRDFVYARDPQVKFRKIERDIEELLKRQSPNLFSRMKNQLGNASMRGIFMVDHVVVLSVWKSVFDNAIRRGLSETEATALAHKVFLNTQPQAAVKDLPDIYRSGELLKALTQFTNQLNQIYNILTFDIPYYLKKDPKTKSISKIVSVLLSSFGIWALTRGRIPQTPKEVADALTETTIASIPVVGGTAVSAKKGFVGSNVPSLQVLTSIGRVISGKRPETKLKGALETGALITGLPFSSLRRGVTGTKELITGETTDFRRLFISKQALGKKETKPFRLKGKKTRKGNRLKF